MAAEGSPKFPETSRVGSFVGAMDGHPLQSGEPSCNGFVCQEHEFLDQLMRSVVEDRFYGFDSPLSVQEKACFPGGKFQ